MRLDVWLWAVRAYKTRPMAVAAIKHGRVEIHGMATKPAREVKRGEIITLRVETDVTNWTRMLRVVEIPPSRVGAKLVPLYAEDLTQEVEREKASLRPGMISGFRERGLGRPTKRDRRALDGIAEGEE
jgi:ribosome-associated heat shock protein Hsp15